MPADIKFKNNIPILNKVLQSAFKDGLEKVGQVAEVMMTARIDSNIPPPLAESTIKLKRSSLALVKTGQLYGQITHEMRGENSVVAGVIGERAKIMAIHEWGAPAAGIPERSVIRFVVNDTRNQNTIKKELSTVIQKACKNSAIK